MPLKEQRNCQSRNPSESFKDEIDDERSLIQALKTNPEDAITFLEKKKTGGGFFTYITTYLASRDA